MVDALWFDTGIGLKACASDTAAWAPGGSCCGCIT
jgi:hypothetical protein